MAKPKKSVDARRSRRRRYIDAIEPFRQQFNCTAAQVYGIINGVMRENSDLKRRVAELEANYANLQGQYDEMLSQKS